MASQWPRKPDWRRIAPHLAWIGLIAAVIAVQWPLLRSIAYGFIGIEDLSRIEWRTDFAAALQEAAAGDRPVLVEFTADWCPGCRMMKLDVWPNSRVEDLVEQHYVPLRLDIDLEQNQPVAAAYHVQAIPTILVLDAQGNIIKGGGPMSPGEMTRFLDPAGG